LNVAIRVRSVGGCLLYGWRVGKPCLGAGDGVEDFGQRPFSAADRAQVGAVLFGNWGLRDSPGIPDQPDRRWVDDWLHCSYLDFWARRD